MRLFAIAALTGSFLLVGGIQAQDGNSGNNNRPAGNSASGKKSGTSRTDMLTEGAPERKLSPAEWQHLTQGNEQGSKEAPAPAQPAPKPDVPAFSIPLVAAVPEVPMGQPTAEQVARVKIGTSEKEMLAALGAPASCLTLPDEGHLRKTCKYWSKGSLVGTIGLDNGKVVRVDAVH